MMSCFLNCDGAGMGRTSMLQLGGVLAGALDSRESGVGAIGARGRWNWPISLLGAASTWLYLRAAFSHWSWRALACRQRRIPAPGAATALQVFGANPGRPFGCSPGR